MKLRRQLRIGSGFGGRHMSRRTVSLHHSTRTDRGAVRLPVIIIAGAAAMFLMRLVAIPLIFGANQLYQNTAEGGDCTDTTTTTTQPRQTDDTDSIPSNYLAPYKKAGQQ